MQCPKCGRVMTWGGSGRNRMVCVPCETPQRYHYEYVNNPEETITDLKRKGKCYCHLMEDRVCQVCKNKANSP